MIPESCNILAQIYIKMNYPEGLKMCAFVCFSGAFRPVMAESGEYVYCPPQRWLNNLHVSHIIGF